MPLMDRMKVKIRKALLSDLEVMQSVARHTIDKNYRPFLGDEGVDWFISGPSDEYMKETINEAFVISEDEDVIGFCVLKENLIDLMIVKHEAHRKGIGTKLLDYCERVLFSDYQEIKLESFEKNDKANSFYTKNSWVKSGIEADEVSGGNKFIFTKNKT
jgi:ribosomal protein S18 acetylase RimI-like enzyme